MAVVSDLLQLGISKLNPVVGDDASRETFLLMAHATGRQVSTLRLNLEDNVDAGSVNKFVHAVEMRSKSQPIAQIIGRRAFWKNDFIVTPDVLDPRPDTETLVEQAAKMRGVRTILDLGVGSGCILLSLLGEFPQATGIGVDVSEAALEVARQNAVSLGYDGRASFKLGNWCHDIDQKFDLVVSNPPYITADAMGGLSPDVLNWEPRIALTPEGDGLGAYRELISGAPKLMNANAYIVLEIGFDQAVAVSDLLFAQGFTNVKTINDINGKDRVVQGQWQ
jgi:release factor glutamine methyltransferase